MIGWSETLATRSSFNFYSSIDNSTLSTLIRLQKNPLGPFLPPDILCSDVRFPKIALMLFQIFSRWLELCLEFAQTSYLSRDFIISIEPCVLLLSRSWNPHLRISALCLTEHFLSKNQSSFLPVAKNRKSIVFDVVNNMILKLPPAPGDPIHSILLVTMYYKASIRSGNGSMLRAALVVRARVVTCSSSRWNFIL